MAIHGMFTSPRFIFFLVFSLCLAIWWIIKKGEKACSEAYHSVTALIPAYNEEITIGKTVADLMANQYICKVIVVNDGSQDRTAVVVEELCQVYSDRLLLISQENTGKAGAINHGLQHVETEYVFLTDADIRIPQDAGLGYLIQALQDGADAVAGIPGSDLNNINFLGKVRASIKIAFATLRKCGGEVLGGHPFCISGSVGMYKLGVLREVGFSNRTTVEDLDLTWELIRRGYKIAQSARAIVFSQEAASLADDLKRWRRWISGYAVCMRIHKGLLFSRFGLCVILMNFFIGLFSILLMILPLLFDLEGALLGQLGWLLLLLLGAAYSASKQEKSWWLIAYAPFSILILFMVFYVWLVWGIPSLVTGKEIAWVKVQRY